jgi:hypothetical protein
LERERFTEGVDDTDQADSLRLFTRSSLILCVGVDELRLLPSPLSMNLLSDPSARDEDSPSSESLESSEHRGNSEVNPKITAPSSFNPQGLLSETYLAMTC